MPKPLAFTLIVVVCGALDIVLHTLTADFLSPLERYGTLVERFGLELVATAWVALAFTGLGLVFLRIERHMAGRGLTKGLRYGPPSGSWCRSPCWTVAMGATIGVLVWLVRDAVRHLQPVVRARRSHEEALQRRASLNTSRTSEARPWCI